MTITFTITGGNNITGSFSFLNSGEAEAEQNHALVQEMALSAAATHIFTITAGNSSTGDLTLTKSGNDDVAPGDTVQWNLQAGATNIQSIDNIHEKAGSTNIFVGEPTKSGNNFSGTISNSATGSETYFIAWTDASGNSQTFDPRLTVSAT